MVADDPFHEPRGRPSSSSAPSPILRPSRPGSHIDLTQLHNNPRASHDDAAHPIPPPPAAVRAPRRVQWQADHVAVPLHELEPHDSQVSDANIADVNDALERFREHRYRPSGLSASSLASMGSMASEDLSDDHHIPHHLRLPHLLAHHRYPPSGQGQEEDDYDYRLDRDPEDDEQRYEGDILDSRINEHMAAYVPPGERDGLPTLRDQSPEGEGQERGEHHSQAADLVRAHTSKWSTLRRRVASGSVRRTGRDEYARVQREDDRPSGSRHQLPRLTVTTSRGHEEGEGQYEKPRQSDDTAVDADTPLNPRLNPPTTSSLRDMPHFPGGTSVLSSLLALYGRHQHDGSGHTTAVNSATTTPAGSDDEAETLDSTDKKDKGHFWNRASLGSEAELKSNRSSASLGDRRSPAPSPGLKGTFARAAHQWKHSDRPKAARSDAGVFGALIGSTGGLAASAVPEASTLIPAAKKQGFHLTRYSLPGTPTHLTPTPPRSRSRADSGSGSLSRPSSVCVADVAADMSTPLMMEGSGTGTGEGSKSTDDLLMMKRSKKKGSTLNLHIAEKARAAESWIKTPTSALAKPGKPMSEDERRRREWEAEKKRRKKAKEQRKKQEVFIIQHVAAILARQQFILKLARALMMFGSPTHRLETQIQATARVLEINAQVVYLPGTMLVSFGDDATHTSETKFLKQSTGLDLGKLLSVHNIYWNVVHDRVSVDDASKDLDALMTSKPLYCAWQIVLVSMCCSAFIVVPSFYGSFVDALMCAVLGGLLAVVQIIATKNDMLSNVFEIVIATLISFISACLSDTNVFCYTALVSGGVVLILPGFIVLTGALELASRNITAGAVRVGYAVIYSLFLGFGISMGGEIYFKIRHKSIKNADDFTCSLTHTADAPWYMHTPSGYWYYLCVPGYALCLSVRNGQPLLRKETVVMIAVACAGWTVNHFCIDVFTKRSDIISAIGSFCVGVLGNAYGRFLSNGASFPVMVTGILMQLPSGLSQGGLFSFAAAGSNISANNGTTTTTTEQYSQGFQVAEQLISVAIGLTVGLFVAAVVTHPLGGSKRRGAGIFSF